MQQRLMLCSLLGLLATQFLPVDSLAVPAQLDLCNPSLQLCVDRKVRDNFRAIEVIELDRRAGGGGGKGGKGHDEPVPGVGGTSGGGTAPGGTPGGSTGNGGFGGGDTEGGFGLAGTEGGFGQAAPAPPPVAPAPVAPKPNCKRADCVPGAPPPPPPPPGGGLRLPGAGAAPKEVAPPVLKKYDPKDVPNPFDKSKYDHTKTVRPDPDSNWGTVTEVRTGNYKGGNTPVDVIAINKDKNSISIMEAFNRDDVPADPKRKLALADIQMNLFTSAGKRPQDLELIHADNVKNTEARSAISNVYKMNGKPTLNAVDITVKASAEAGSVERNSFNTLLGTAFGIGADKLRQQYSVGKQITAFKVSNHKTANGENDLGKFDSKQPLSTKNFLVFLDSC